MVMSRDQNAGQSHSMKIDNSSFASVEAFKYLGTSLKNQNSIEEDIKSHNSVQKFCLQQHQLGSDYIYIRVYVIYFVCNFDVVRYNEYFGNAIC